MRSEDKRRDRIARIEAALSNYPWEIGRRKAIAMQEERQRLYQGINLMWKCYKCGREYTDEQLRRHSSICDCGYIVLIKKGARRENEAEVEIPD